MTSESSSLFSSLGLSSELALVAQELGFKGPTSVQEQAIPLLLQGKDLIAQSQTGSGKTAAFTLPMLQKISLEVRVQAGARAGFKDRSVRALVLCPTRELCAQVAREIRKLGRRQAGLQVLILSGGMPIGPQFAALERGVHIVVGTPGRVMDHIRRRSLDLRRTSTLVLDEADRMLEMGFQEDIEQIIAELPESRQSVLFSATFPKTIEELSSAYQRDPVRVTIERSNQTVASIQQLFCEVDPIEKTKAVLGIIEKFKPESLIVFCNFKASVAGLAQELSRSGVSCGALHGDLEQRDRDRIMAKFRNKSLRVMVATDVAARGIDVESLDAVVNFELPSQPEIYVHRIGRTGRAGKEGLAISLVSKKEQHKIREIEKYSGAKFEKLDLSSVRELDVSQVQPAQAQMKTLYISGGRKEKMRPGDILGALTGDAGGLQAQDVGKIEIHDHFSYVAVSASIAELALERLRNGRIKGRKFRIEPVR